MDSKLHEEIFGDFLNEIKSKVSRKITVDLVKILNEKPSLESNKIKSTIFDISDFYYYFPQEINSKETYFDKFLELYDNCLSDRDKFLMLLRINEKESFKRFALKHYESLIKEFRRTIFVDNSTVSELDELGDMQIKIDYLYGKDKYKAEWWFDGNLAIVGELYKLFGDNIKIFYNGVIEKYNLNQLYYIKNEDLEELFHHELSSECSNVSQFLVALGARNRQDKKTDLTKISSFITSENEVRKILTEIRKNYKSNLFENADIKSFSSKIYNEILRKRVENISFSENDKLDDIFSVNYLKALNVLASYSKVEISKSSLYLKCFKIFLEEFLKGYKAEVTEEIIFIIENLFKRVINKKDIVNILSIDNEKSLWHFYKTDEIITDLRISLDLIKKSNSKQYKQLKRELNVKDDELDVAFFKDKLESTETVLKLLNYFGYDFSKKIISLSRKKIDRVLEFISQKSQKYKDSLKKVLNYQLDILSDTYFYDIEAFLVCFDMLYVQGCKNITFNRVVKSIDSLSYALLPSNKHIEKNLNKLNLVAKGEPLLEKVEGIKLYDKYRFRRDSAIPDIAGSFQGLNYSMVDLHSPEIISNGIGNYILPSGVRASSCLTPNGKAASSLRHGALDPNGRFFKVEDDNEIVAYSWVWRIGDVVCFDNIEVTDRIFNFENYEKKIYEIYSKVSEELIDITKKYEKRGVKLVVLGRNEIDLANKFFDRLVEVKQENRELFKPINSEELYLKDSSSKQIVLAGDLEENLRLENVLPIYKYQRTKVKNFSELSKEELYRRINSIYFDYCVSSNKKYRAVEDKYKNGYLGEDWFVGIDSNDNTEFYYCGNDKRLFEEAQRFMKEDITKSSFKVNIVQPDKENIRRILDSKNIEVDYQKINSYLNSSERNYFELLPEYYTHHSSNLDNFVKILENNAITSSAYGNHPGGVGCNGRHFISVAGAYANYLEVPTFVITSDICAFAAISKFKTSNVDDNFRDTDYPFRFPNHEWEFHVLNSITLDKVKAIYGTTKNLTELAQIIYIQELFENKLPLIEIRDHSYINKEVIKKYSKLRK